MRIEFVMIAAAIALGLVGYLAFQTAREAPDRTPTAQPSATPPQAPGPAQQ